MDENKKLLKINTNFLNGTDNELANIIRKLRRDVFNLQSKTQPSYIEWLPFVETLTYVSSEEVTCSNTSVDLRGLFNIGDPVRYKQGGGFKYGSTTKVTATNLRISAGSDYSVVSADITDFARGLKNNPVGYPFVFNYDAAWDDPGGQLGQAPSSEVSQFWITGRIANIDLHFDGDDMTSPTSSIFAKLPVLPALLADNPQYPCFATNNFIPQTASAKLGTTVISSQTYNLELQPIIDTGFANWATSTNGVGVDVTLSYLIDSDT